MFVIVAILLVFVVVIVTYSCILRLVYQSEKNMRKKKPTNVALVDFQSADSANTLEFDSKTKEYVRLKRTIKLARTVTKLITTYLVCHAPLLLYLLIRITAPKLLVDKKKQIVFLAENTGRAVLGGACAAGVGALCFYGLGLSNDVGAIDKARYVTTF